MKSILVKFYLFYLCIKFSSIFEFRLFFKHNLTKILTGFHFIAVHFVLYFCSLFMQSFSSVLLHFSNIFFKRTVKKEA